MAKSSSNQFLKKHKVTIIMVGCLVIIFIALILLFTKPQSPSDMNPTPSPMQSADNSGAMMYPKTDTALIASSLSMVKDNGAVDVVLDTGVDQVDGIQLGISYDPTAITNVAITPGSFLSEPIVLQNLVNPKTGLIHFAIAVKPGTQPIKGKGVVAIITYTPVAGAKPSSLSFTPRTKITSMGINTSVLHTTTTLPL